MSQRDSYAREVKTLKASLAEAKRRLRDLVDMSDEELRVLEESKKVASELDELKTKYAESMGIAVSEVEDEDVAGLDITKIDTIVAPPHQNQVSKQDRRGLLQATPRHEQEVSEEEQSRPPARARALLVTVKAPGRRRVR